MVVFKSLDPGTSNVDPGNEEQPIEGTAPAEVDLEPAAPSTLRHQPTVVITLEALQSLCRVVWIRRYRQLLLVLEARRLRQHLYLARRL